MKNLHFVVRAIFIVLAFVVISTSLSFGCEINIFGLGSGVLAVSPALVALDREYYQLLAGTYGKGAPQPSYLRVEETLLNNKTRYDFNIKTTGSELATERKLDRNDIFVVTHLGIYLIAQVSTTIGLEILQTYPNPDVFVTATGFTPNHLNVIYSGWLEIKIGQRVNAEAIDLNRFRFVPTSQQEATNNFINYSEYHQEANSYWHPNLFYLHGTQNIDIHVEFPAITGAAYAAVAANTSNRIVLYPMGYLIKNKAKQLA